MKNLKLWILALALMVTPLAFSQEPIQPARADLNVVLFPREHLIKVDLTLYLTKELIEDGKLSFGIGEEFKIEKAYFLIDEPLQFTQEREDVSISTGELGDSRSKMLHIVYQSRARSTQGRQAIVDEKGSYFSWLGGWTPFLPQTSGFVGTSRITAPENLVVTTQGQLVSEEIQNGIKTTTFKVTKPCYYSLIAASYQLYTSRIEELEFRTYFFNGSREKHLFYKKNMEKALKGLEKNYGPYPYDYLCVVETPKIEGLRVLGSSEQGLMPIGEIATADNYFNFPILIHELAHMWFGNWVIGQEITMSETFAQLGVFLAAEEVFGEEIMRKLLLNGSPDHFMCLALYLRNFASLDQEEPNLVVGNYNYPEYLVIQGKGPSVLLMLRDKVGQEAFSKGITKAVEKYAHQRMTMEQFRVEMEHASDMKLEEFFKQWIYSPGAPHLSLEWVAEEVEGGYLAKGRIKQVQNPFYSMPVELVVKSGDTETKHSVNLSGQITEFSIPLEQKPDLVLLDPLRKSLWISEDDKNRNEFAAANSFSTTAQETKDRLKKYLEENPGDKLALALQAKYSLRVNPENEETLNLLERVVRETDPFGELELFHSWAAYELSRIYYRTGENEKASHLLEKLIKEDRTGRYGKQAKSLLTEIKTS